MTHNHGVQRRIAKGLVAGLAVLVVLVGGLLWSAPRTDVVPLRAAQAVRIPVGAEPDGAPVALDADLYVPGGSDPAPAVVLAHGFGGDKADLRTEASRLAARGYVVLAYTSRGFGESGGRIHLMDPDYEVADAARVIDYLAGQDRVARSGGNDPRVAVVGGSYGGALALMAAARDQRVDAVVALITWNDLAQAFFPQAAQQDAGTALGPAEPIDEPGPYKQLWGANFLLGALGAGDAGNAGVGEGSGCGRFDPDLCRRFIRAAETGRPDAQLLTELRAHSPAPTLSQVNAPVYLIQGMSDTLFGLDQADASARALLAANTPVSVRWTNGGHDQGGGAASGLAAGGSASVRAEAQQVSDSIDLFLDRHLRPESRAVAALPGFTYAVRLRRGQDVAATYTLSSYADVLASSTRRGVLALPLRVREAATVVNPPGGVPSAITVVPGGLGVGAASYQLAALPGQHLALDSEVINADVLGAGVLDAAATGEAGVVAGAPRLSLEVTSSGREVSLYASLWQVQGGTARLLRPLTAAARVTVTPGTPQKVDLLLPMATWELAEGSRWRVLITTTDAAYRGTSTTRVDRVSLAEPTLLLPVARGATGSPAPLLDRESVWVLGLTGLLLAAGAVAALSA
ncbi:alpha/beta fold hydrolase, partial [Nostocoides sp.]